MKTFLNRSEQESKVEDILLLYAADSIASIDDGMLSNVCWSGTAIKAAYKLGRSLGMELNDLAFDVPILDEAMRKGRFDQVALDNHSPLLPAKNIRYIAS